MVPVVIGALGAVTPKLEQCLQQIPGATSQVSVQKSIILGKGKIAPKPQTPRPNKVDTFFNLKMIIFLVVFFSFTVFILKSEFISTTNIYLKLECKQKLEAEFKNRSRNPPA